MRPHPAEPLAVCVTGAFTLLVVGSLSILCLLTFLVLSSAWPRDLELIEIQGKTTCIERLGSDAHGQWVRKSGQGDAWLLPANALDNARPTRGYSAMLLQDGRWFCSPNLELRESDGGYSSPSSRELVESTAAFHQDLLRLHSNARTGDTAAIAESRRLHALGKLLRIRIGNDSSRLEIPIQEIQSLRPDHPSFPEKIAILVQTLALQFRSSPSSFASLTGTVLATLLATLLASPLAIAAAIWLSEFSRPGKVAWLFRQSVQLLAGIPPVVFGAFGLVVLIRGAAPALDAPLATPSLLWASLTLTFLALPTVTRQAHIALRQVPSHLREASLCSGATRLQTLRHVVLPGARRGLWAAILMGSVQALAETAPLLLTGAVQLAGHPLLDGSAPWVHLGGGFEHLGTRIYHGIEQFPPGPLGTGAGSLACLVLAASAIALRTWAAALRHPRNGP
ncbi:MAG: hypothetical protein RL318_505 [Fibrobacterota bacterium]|jgi:ABC-type phosphate transport system permease subunit